MQVFKNLIEANSVEELLNKNEMDIEKLEIIKNKEKIGSKPLISTPSFRKHLRWLILLTYGFNETQWKCIFGGNVKEVDDLESLAFAINCFLSIKRYSFFRKKLRIQCPA